MLCLRRAFGLLSSTTLVLCAAALPATAFPEVNDSSGVQQTPPLQEVTVSARRLDKDLLEQVIIPRFVESHGAPNPRTNQVGRWMSPWTICPKIRGVKPAAQDYVAHRIIDVATHVGAPAEADPQCKATVEVIFTPNPQDQVTYFARHYRKILGVTPVSLKDRVTFKNQIRAWYQTATHTNNGWGEDLDDTLMDPKATAGGVTGRVVYNMEGPTDDQRFTSGLTSGFANVLVVIDSKQVTPYTLSAISDYIAMLVLSRTAQNGCSELPSIVDLFSPDCAGRAAPSSMTAADMAYLKALYAADLEKNLHIEKIDLHQRMLDGVLGN
jgi:hypothetical protein